MSSITWSALTKLMRGVVVEAKDSSPIDEISASECWEKVAVLNKALGNPTEPISVSCEIWPDTGRIIWIQKDRREFCRIELTVPELERKYFEISAVQDFEHEYNRLLGQIRRIVKNGSEQIDLRFAQRISIRDSDNKATEEVLS